MMLKLCRLLLAFTCAIQIRCTNIMLHKPTKQSSTHTTGNHHTYRSYGSNYATDGSASSYSHTRYETNPYWQGDLLGFHIVDSIAITSDNVGSATYLRNAMVGVSVHDVTCSEDRLTICGQWSDQHLSATTLTFNCTDAGPIRYVRVWHEVSGYLALAEVQVEGEPGRLQGTKYDKHMLQKVTSYLSAQTVSSGTDCGTKCHRTQPCIAFSYSPFEKPNCLLATSTGMTSNSNWVSYTVTSCFGNITCDLSAKTDWP